MGKVKLSKASTGKRNISKFFWTINSNQVDDDNFQRRVLKILEHADRFLKVREGYQPDPDMEVEVNYDFEKGDIQERLHCHATIVVRHNSNILVDYKKMHEVAKKYNYWINSKFQKPTADDISDAKVRNYIKKKNKQ